MPGEGYDAPPESVRQAQAPTPRWRRRIALAVFAAVAAYFLLTEHRAHVIQALPWALVLLCPLMHVFMHRGHGDHGSRGHDGASAHGPHGGPR